MEPIIIETSQGHKVYLKSTLNYGDEETVEDYRDGMIQVDPFTQKPLPISLTTVKAASRKAFELLLIKVVLPDGSNAADPMQAIREMSGADGRMIKEKADEIYRSTKLTKKTRIPQRKSI